MQTGSCVFCPVFPQLSWVQNFDQSLSKFKSYYLDRDQVDLQSVRHWWLCNFEDKTASCCKVNVVLRFF